MKASLPSFESILSIYPDAGKMVFRSSWSFVPRHEFHTCVRRYGGDNRLRGFSCRDQFLCLAFAQLTFRESLRGIETSLRAVGAEAVSCGVSGASLAEHIGGREPRS
jgi:Domain of unknown function (DUF4372)